VSVPNDHPFSVQTAAAVKSFRPIATADAINAPISDGAALIQAFSDSHTPKESVAEAVGISWSIDRG
jgi:hypothetical protein